MKLRRTLRTRVVLMLGLAAATSVAVGAKPNIIVIYTDDQGFGDASCLNPEANSRHPTWIV